MSTLTTPERVQLPGPAIMANPGAFDEWYRKQSTDVQRGILIAVGQTLQVLTPEQKQSLATIMAVDALNQAQSGLGFSAATWTGIGSVLGALGSIGVGLVGQDMQADQQKELAKEAGKVQLAIAQQQAEAQAEIQKLQIQAQVEAAKIAAGAQVEVAKVQYPNGAQGVMAKVLSPMPLMIIVGVAALGTGAYFLLRKRA